MTREQQGVVVFLGLIMLSWLLMDYTPLVAPRFREEVKGPQLGPSSLPEMAKEPLPSPAKAVGEDWPKLPTLFMVNINTATWEELSTLPGIGPKTAQAIIEFREKHGPFKSPEDLLQVRGLGPKKLAAIRERLTAP